MKPSLCIKQVTRYLPSVYEDPNRPIVFTDDTEKTSNQDYACMHYHRSELQTKKWGSLRVKTASLHKISKPDTEIHHHQDQRVFNLRAR